MVSGTNICLYPSIILMFLAQSHVRSICMTHQFNFFQNIILFIFGCAGSWLLHGLFSSCSEQGLLSSCSVRASHCSDFSRCRAQALGHPGFSSCSSQLYSTGSTVCRSFFKACGIFLDRGSNLCLLRCQANSLPLSHQGSPQLFKYIF